MSSSNPKIQKKTQTTTRECNESEILKPGCAICARKPEKKVSDQNNKNDRIQKFHNALVSIQREYEQLQINMEEHD